MQNLVNRLEKRGWSKKEIAKAVKIIQKAKLNKTRENLFLERRIYWILLVLVITSNFAISVALLPLLIALKGVFLYAVLIVLGLVFGLLFELVTRSIEHLEKKHHLILAVLIPIIALANVFVIARLSNNLAQSIALQNIHNAFAVALVYAASFVIPYIIYRFILKIEYYARE